MAKPSLRYLLVAAAAIIAFAAILLSLFLEAPSPASGVLNPPPARQVAEPVVASTQPLAPAPKPGFHQFRKPGEEPGWAVRYGKEFWRAPQTLKVANHGAPFDVSGTMDRVRHSFAGDADPLDVKAATFRVELDGDGFRFSPHKPGLDGKLPQPSGSSLTAKTAAIWVGSETLYRSGRALEWSVNGNIAQALLSPESGILEHYDVRREGVAVTWVLDRKPAQPGDVEIEWNLSGLYPGPQTASGRHYVDGQGTPRVRIGNVTAVDARGVATPLSTSMRNGNLAIRIPQSLVESAGYPLAIDPTVSAEFELDQPVNLAEGNSLSPLVSSNGTNTLVVWEEAGTPSLFYGAVITSDGSSLSSTVPRYVHEPSDLVSLGAVCANEAGDWLVLLDRDDDVIAALVDSTGEVLSGDEGIEICTLSSDQSNAALASVGTSWFVVWDDDRSTSARDIFGTLVNSEGVVQTADGSAICTANMRQRFPVIAGNGSSYCVAWEDNRESNISEIYGAVISATGTITLPDMLIDDQPVLSHQTQPKIAACGSVWLVIWQDGRNDVGDVYGAIVDPVNGPQPDFEIVATTGSQAGYMASSNGSAFYVIWLDPRSSEFDVYGTLVSKAGAVLNVDGVLLTPADGTNVSRFALAASGSEWLFAWVDASVGNSDISGRFIESSGTPAASGIFSVVSDSSNQAGVVLVGNTTGWTACWIDSRSGVVNEVYSAGVLAYDDLLPANGQLVSVTANSEVDIALASNGDTWFAAWKDNRNSATTGYDIYGMLVDSDGTPLFTDGIAINTEAEEQREPSVDASGSDYFVAWSNRVAADPLVEGTVINSDGVVQQATGIEIGNPNDANFATSVKVTGNGTNWLVSWEQPSWMGAILSPGGTILRSISLGGPTNGHDVVASNGDWLYIWAKGTNKVSYGICRGTDFSQNPDEIDITSTSSVQLHPTAAATATGWLAAWEDQRSGDFDIYASLISSAGVVGSEIPVCTAAEDQSSIAASTAGSQTLLAWTDLRNDISGDIYAAILNSGGVVQQADGFAIAEGAEEQDGVQLDSQGTQWLAAWDTESGVEAATIQADALTASADLTDADASGVKVAVGSGKSALAVYQCNDYGFTFSGTERAAGQVVTMTLAQSVDFEEIADQAFSSTPITLSAVASSGLGVTFSLISGPATLIGDQLTLTGSGTVVVQADQAGSTEFDPAHAQQSFTVSKRFQSVSFGPISNRNFSDKAFTIGGSSSLGLGLSYSVVSGPAKITENRVTMTGLGKVTLRASSAGDSVTQEAGATTFFTIFDKIDPKVSTDTSVRTSSSSGRVRGTATDNYSVKELRYRVRFAGKQGSFKSQRLSGTRDRKSFSLRIPTAAAGQYEVEIVAIDFSGNESSKKKVSIVRSE